MIALLLLLALLLPCVFCLLATACFFGGGLALLILARLRIALRLFVLPCFGGLAIPGGLLLAPAICLGLFTSILLIFRPRYSGASILLIHAAFGILFCCRTALAFLRLLSGGACLAFHGFALRFGAGARFVLGDHLAFSILLSLSRCCALLLLADFRLALAILRLAGCLLAYFCLLPRQHRRLLFLFFLFFLLLTPVLRFCFGALQTGGAFFLLAPGFRFRFSAC